jgi:hypothetical protein
LFTAAELVVLKIIAMAAVGASILVLAAEENVRVLAILALAGMLMVWYWF